MEEIANVIGARFAEERKWMTAYLLDEIFAVPELRQTAWELAELVRRRGDLLAVPESRKQRRKNIEEADNGRE